MSTPPLPPTRTPRDYVRLFFVGIAMGMADVVPGVSGGTMAFILGIYEELINAIKSFNLTLLKHLAAFRLRDAFNHIPWQFLVVLLGGIATAFLTFAHVIDWAMTHHQELLFAFFFGLILASILVVGATIRWTWQTFLSLAAGSLLAYWIVGLVPLAMPHDPITLFFSGAISIMAMILPGISGSFLLLILGQYTYFIQTVKELNFLPLLPLFAGMIVGITSFARVLSWLLRHYHQATVAALTGFMVGSLRRIWPWKETLEWMTDRHGQLVPKIQANILPDVASGQFWAALLLCLLGFLIVSILDHLQTQSNPVLRLVGVGGTPTHHEVATLEEKP